MTLVQASMPKIMVRQLTKSFGKVEALKGVDFDVQEGEILAILGPNGAGKTTLVRILTTLLYPDKGGARIGEYQIISQPKKVRTIIGLAGQNAAVDENLTGYENLEMVGRLYHLSKPEAQKRAKELLKRFDLEAAQKRTVKTYSGGMRRRLDLAASLVGKPEILFLDEPTTGLDPRSRNELWNVLEDLASDGTTIVLTTQYLEEADRLADRVIVVDKGTIIAEGTPTALKDRFGGNVLEVHIEDNEKIGAAAQILSSLSNEQPHVDELDGHIRLPVSDKNAVVQTVRLMDEAKIPLAHVALRQPTLDDVFLALTGHETEEPNQK